MAATRPTPAPELGTHLKQVQVLSERLIAKLAERAAYASDDEYEEIRDLMTALRGLGATKQA
jgi:hypothetical protein